jgi:hypothetical protein
MSEINYFKVFIMCSDDVAADVDHLYMKIIYWVSFSYIVIEDLMGCVPTKISFCNVTSGMEDT